MLRTLRNQAGSLWAKTLLALLVLSFGVWGVGDMVQSGGAGRAVAEIGGEEISQSAFLRAYERETESLQQTLGPSYSPQIALALNLPMHTLEKLVNTRLLRMEAQRIGLMPSDEEIARTIMENEMFHAGGSFSRDQYRRLLRSSQMTEAGYTEDVRRQLADETLRRTLEAAILPLMTDTAAETLHAISHERRRAELLLLPVSLIPEPQTPEEETLRNFYRDHEEAYTAPEMRTLSYLVIRPEKLETQVDDEAVAAAYRERLEEFKRPETRTVEQMLFASQEAAQKAHEMLAGGSKFTEAAQKAGAENKELSLGELTINNLPDISHAQEVFALPEGGHTPPLKGDFGWHIYRVASVKPSHTLSLEEAKPQIEKDLRVQKTEEALHDASIRIEDALAGGATVEEAAEMFALEAVRLKPVNRNGLTTEGKPGELPAYPGFLQTAFEVDEQSESAVLPTGDGGYFILRVEHVNPRHPLSFAEVEAQVAADWKAQERMKKLGELAENAAKKLDASSLEKIRSEIGGDKAQIGPLTRNDEVRAAGAPLPAQLKKELFSLAEGKHTAPYPLEEDRYAIAVLREIIPAARPDEKTLREARASLEQAMQAEIYEQYLLALRDRYHVVVHEDVIAELAEAK